MILVGLGSEQVFAESTMSTGSRWQSASPQDTRSLKKKPEKATAPARVRIGLKLTPFNKVVNITKGKKNTQFVPENILRHTLRARLNKVNHFFVSDFHIETRPLSWIKKNRKYKLRLNIYRRYGAFGQLEEKVGSMDIAGILEEQDKNIFILYGSNAKRLRNKFGQPVLDIVAGYRPGETAGARTATKSKGKRPTPRKKPNNAQGSSIRGRF
jgi:hypothetical protein